MQDPAKHRSDDREVREIRRSDDRILGRLKSSDSRRPPGLNTRAISSIAVLRSGTLRNPYPVVTRSNEDDRNGRLVMSPVMSST
jgi:hypothetical protein